METLTAIVYVHTTQQQLGCLLFWIRSWILVGNTSKTLRLFAQLQPRCSSALFRTTSKRNASLSGQSPSEILEASSGRDGIQGTQWTNRFVWRTVLVNLEEMAEMGTEERKVKMPVTEILFILTVVFASEISSRNIHIL